MVIEPFVIFFMIILLNFKTTTHHRLPTSHITAGMLFMLNVYAAYVVLNLQHVVHYFAISLLNFIMTTYAAWLL